MKGKTFAAPKPAADALPARTSPPNAATPRRVNPKAPRELSDSAERGNLADLVLRSRGKLVVATVAPGTRYLGLLLTADVTKSGISVVLEGPKLVSKAYNDQKANTGAALPPTLTIAAADLIDVEVKHPQKEADKQKMASSEPYVVKKTARLGFRTDADISSGFRSRERELQKWVPDDTSLELSLEDSSNGTWDQFKVNEQKFGVGSTYDEHLYTTRIDTQAHDYAQRLQRAEKLAQEIEGNTSTDRHVMEERGVVIDSGLDEEDKYSGVHQEPVDTRGQELMAALRGGSGAKPPLPGSKVLYDIPGPSDYPSEILAARTKKAEKPLDGKPSSIPNKPQVQANGESFRLNAQSEINSLREFSANFKVPHKIPNDLLPILSKDKEKQDEILKKQREKKASQVALEGKSDSRFKLNPKAAAFTPSAKTTQVSPVPPKANFGKSSSNASPRISSLRAYGTASSGSGISKRHHQISAAEFFGGADKVPTAEGQKSKIDKVNQSFLLFAHARRQHDPSAGPLVLVKAFHTPPTWDSTVDVSYEELLAQQTLKGNRTPSMMPMPSMPFLPNPLMAVPGAGLPMGAGFPAGVKYPASPHLQSQTSLAAQFQQQQYQMAMLYQQQLQGGVPFGQQHVMYAGPGEPQFMPPGFVVHDFGHPGSPVGANMAGAAHGFGNGGPGQHNYNTHQNHGKRYNGQGRRGESHHS